jgi:hypothetical protein
MRSEISERRKGGGGMGIGGAVAESRLWSRSKSKITIKVTKGRGSRSYGMVNSR